MKYFYLCGVMGRNPSHVNRRLTLRVVKLPIELFKSQLVKRLHSLSILLYNDIWVQIRFAM
nr:MAG TPA: hypothetical protein [Caudoviricetes sp.]